MAAGAIIPYNNGLLNLTKTVAFETDTIIAILLDDAYTPDVGLHDFLDDLTADEITDTDYARQTLTGKAHNLDGSGRTRWDADIVNFGDTVTISARYMAIVKDTGTPATSPVLWYVDLNDGGSGNVGSTAADFKVDFHVDGIYRIVP